MENFKEQKEEIIKRAKESNACQTEFKKAIASKNVNELIAVVKDNLRWCIVNNMLDAESLEIIFGIELLKENHIYTQGVNDVRVTEGNAYIVTLGSSSANVETWGSSSANVETLGSSSANVKTLGSSSANVKTLGSSSANVKTLDSSSKLETKVEGLNSLIRNHNTRTIYIKKDNFTIQIID